jgi:short-subunit dehydrogenase
LSIPTGLLDKTGRSVLICSAVADLLARKVELMAYVLSFTEALWAETRGTGVRVTALCPGATDTAFFDTASDSASIGRRMAPRPVVAAAFSALDRRRSMVVPGLGSRLLAGSHPPDLPAGSRAAS